MATWVTRTIIRSLRSEYGVRPQLRTGGKHPKLEFEYGGQWHYLTLPSSPSVDRDTAVKYINGQVRRKLGPPLPTSTDRPKRTMEEMMPEPPKLHHPWEPAPSFNPIPLPPTLVASLTTEKAEDRPIQPNARLGCYMTSDRQTQRVRITVPRTMLAPNIRVAVTHPDSDTWEIKPNYEGIKTSAPSALRTEISFQAAHLVPSETFQASPAKAIEIDGGIRVRCNSAMRQPTERPAPIPTPVAPDRTAETLITEIKTRYPTAYAIEKSRNRVAPHTDIKELMLVALHAIRNAEAALNAQGHRDELRLRVREDGTTFWEWYVPPVRL